MYYGQIKPIDIANGNGVRVSLFVSGCRRHCEGCFQPETWNFEYGKEFNEQTQQKIFDALKPSYIQGLSVLGGDPFEKENQKVLRPFLKEFRRQFPERDLWVWTGYEFDSDLQPGGRQHSEDTDEILSCIDVLVDGPFKIDQKDITLQFRGSANQRLIDVPASLTSGQVVLFDPTYVRI